MPDLSRINQRIDSFRNAMIDMQIRLCAIPAISPESGGEGEAEKAELLLEYLNSSGFDSISSLKSRARARKRPSGS
jgi:succinyl-diaminopimelate desuccinylase